TSVTKIQPDFGIFDEPFLRVAGKDRSLNEVEKVMLLKRWKEPRIHFAVNCASVSCPPLRREAFRGDRLEEQLTEQTRLFAASFEAAQVSGRDVEVSALFDWYASDFGGDPISYLNLYREEALPTNGQVTYLEYNWDLNASS
ncbi:MAG: DUF547 domain-containing protein, partial [Verrucomicrobiota bacterium]